MQCVIVSCLEQVPRLAAQYRPDRLLSIAAAPPTPPDLTASQHLILNFADIDKPTARNIGLAASADDIAPIRALAGVDRVLINCKQGQRRSPTAALILLTTIYPKQSAAIATWIRDKAPYVDFNPWMLRVAGIDPGSIPAAGQPRRPPPRGCFFVLDLGDAPMGDASQD
jgi:predicted protein tyrosine phosphatase